MKLYRLLFFLLVIAGWHGTALAACTMSVSGVKSNITCNGAADGAVDVSVTGAVGTVTYEWNDGATTEDRTGLSPGTYTITVTDDNCSRQKTFNITEPSALSISSIVNNATTPGGSDGSITLTVSGGTQPYDFLWNTGAVTQDLSNLPAGTYAVIITDKNDCALADTFSVFDASCQIQVFPSSPSICEGSSSGVQLIVTSFGATGYDWSPSTGLSATTGASVVATPDSTQTYTVTANNLSDCSASITVLVNPVPVVNQIADTAYCNGVAAKIIKFSSATAGAAFHWTSDRNIGFGTSGDNNNISYTATNGGNETDTATITVYATANDCQGPGMQFKIMVHPTPLLDSIANITYCNGENSPGVMFTSNVTGSTFQWTSSQDVGFGNTGNGNIGAFVAANSGNITKTATIKVVVTANGCKSAKPQADFSINVEPSPLMIAVPNKIYCNGETISGITFSSNPAGDEFHWTSSLNIGFGISGVGNIPGFVVLNADTVTVTDTVKVYATKAGCDGPVSIFIISVVPTPNFTSPTIKNVCNGIPFTYQATANINTSFSWTRPLVTGISNSAASGNGSFISETLNNTTNHDVVVGYNFQMNTGGSCISYDTLLVTVTPTASVSSSLTESVCDDAPFVYLATSETPGTIFSWSRAAVPGISNLASSDTSNLINESLDNTTANNITVTYTFTVGAGGCPATNQQLNVTVKATPELTDSVLFYSICNDAVFSTTLSSATANTTFSWERPAVPGIIPESNQDESIIISESLQDTTSNPVTTLYIVTLSHENCENISLLFVTVNPVLRLSSDTAFTICDSIPFVYQAESATVGTTFSWTRALTPGISNAAASGNSNLINETLTNTTNLPVDVTYLFTLTIDTCSYVQPIHVTVNPSPKVDAVANKNYCNDVAVAGIPFSSNVAGATFSWTSTQDIGFGTSGSGDIPAFVAMNAGFTPIVDTIAVYASAYLCDGPLSFFTITINPTPVLNSYTDTTLCNNVLYVYQAGSPTPGTTFSWIRPHVDGINPFAGSGTNSFINETLTNTTQAPITISYIFSLTIDTCTNLQYLQVTVNPTPEMSSTADTAICDGVLFHYLATGATNGTNFSWSRDSIAGIANAPGSGNDSLIHETLDNITLAPVTVAYDFTLTYTNVVTCVNHALLEVKVNPSPPLPSFTSLSPDSLPITVCGGAANINFNINQPQGANGVTYLWTATPGDAADIGNSSNPNTVITFHNTAGQVKIKVYAMNSDSLGGCPDSVEQVVNVTANPDSISTRKIILKQPGNLLVYPDNSMNAGSGEHNYQWGYDEIVGIDAVTLDTLLGPPQEIAGQVYQFFVPEAKFINSSGTDVATDKYCFWVLLKRGDCQSKVYYNGPYAPPGKLVDEGTDASISVKAFPNPTTGSFRVLLTGNMYGSIAARMYNTLGAVVFSSGFIKNNYESSEYFEDLNLPDGIYHLELISTDEQRAVARIVVAQ